jgi:hypothetical protein
MTGKWRRDLLAAQQIGLPSLVGLLLVAAGLSAILLPWPYGWVVGVVGLALIAALLYRSVRRRRQGIDGWPTAVILAPFVAMTVFVIIGTLVPGPLAAALAGALVVGGVGLLVRRLRHSGEPPRPAHHFRGTTNPDETGRSRPPPASL